MKLGDRIEIKDMRYFHDDFTKWRPAEVVGVCPEGKFFKARYLNGYHMGEGRNQIWLLEATKGDNWR